MTDHDARGCPSGQKDIPVAAGSQAEAARAVGNWKRLGKMAEALIEMARRHVRDHATPSERAISDSEQK